MAVALIVGGIVLALISVLVLPIALLQSARLPGAVGLLIAAAGITGICLGATIIHNSNQATLASHLQDKYGVTLMEDTGWGNRKELVLVKLSDGDHASCHLYGSDANPVAVCSGTELPRI